MEAKDILTIIGLAIIIGLGVVNLFILLANRRNNLREHLYKEQLIVLGKLGVQLKNLMDIFDNIIFENKWSDEKDDLVEKEIKVLDFMIDANALLLQEDLYDAISEVWGKAHVLHQALVKGDGKVDETDFEDFISVIDKTIDKFREHIGVDQLSQENKGLYKTKTEKKWQILAK